MVTGASGHVGANLVRALLAQGRRVRCLIHYDRRAIDGLEVEIVEGDVCDRVSLCRAFAGADVVYHLAGHISISMADWSLVERINVTGAGNVVEACLSCGVHRLVHFSSIHAFSQEPLDCTLDELRSAVDSRHCPPYDRSKAAGELEIRRGIERGLDAIIINPTAIIGPYDYKPSHFGEALLAMAQRKLPALVEGGFDWVDVRDVVEGAIRAEKKAPTGSRYLLSGHWVALRDVAVQVAEVVGIAPPHLTLPLGLAYLGVPFSAAYSRLTGKRPLYTTASLKAMRSNRCISHEKATRELGYQPRLFRETLVDTLSWFEENGKLGCRARQLARSL